MNNKNMILGIGFVLLSIIAYQGYELYKVNHPSETTKIQQEKEKKAEENKPQININIAQTSSTKQNKSNSNLTKEQQFELDQQRIQKSLQELFKSIFSSKEVQEGLTEFKAQAQIGFQEFQKELQNLPKEFDKLSSQIKDDPILSQFFQTIKSVNGGIFEDMGDYFYTKIELENGQNSKVDISTNEHYLIVIITNKKSQTTGDNNTTINQSSSFSKKYILALPQNALVEKLQTYYKNNILEITIPKIKKGKKI